MVLFQTYLEMGTTSSVSKPTLGLWFNCFTNPLSTTYLQKGNTKCNSHHQISQNSEIHKGTYGFSEPGVPKYAEEIAECKEGSERDWQATDAGSAAEVKPGLTLDKIYCMADQRMQFSSASMQQAPFLKMEFYLLTVEREAKSIRYLYFQPAHLQSTWSLSIQ